MEMPRLIIPGLSAIPFGLACTGLGKSGRVRCLWGVVDSVEVRELLSDRPKGFCKEIPGVLMNACAIEREIVALIEAFSGRCYDPLVYGNDFEVIIQNPGRSEDVPLPPETIVVYAFFKVGDEECLKVGQAGENSGDRFKNQHYRVDPKQSSLAKASSMIRL